MIYGDILAAVVSLADLNDTIEEMNESALVQKRQFLMRDRISWLIFLSTHFSMIFHVIDKYSKNISDCIFPEL